VTDDGQSVELDAFRGRYLVVYFYPKAFTPGCTRETVRFRDSHDEIRALGGDIVGVSIDDPAVQCEFAKRTRAPFPLVGDPNGIISRAWGVRRKLLPVDRRVTFVVDPDGKIAAQFEHEFLADRHVDDVLEFLERRKTASASS
jgi:peroxiredoxin